MNVKRGLLLLIVLLLFVSVFAACAPKEEPQWSIAIEGADKAAFTNMDYEKLSEVKIDAVLKKKDGSEKNESWEGVLLKDVLEYVGALEYTSVTMEAADGYAKDYTPQIVHDTQTILGTKVDGGALSAEDGFVQSVAAGQSGNMWIRQLIRIKVNK